MLFFVLGGFIVFFCFLLCSSRFLSCLIIVENLNVLILLSSLFCQWWEFRVIFIVLMVVFTIEVTVGLVVLTRLWSESYMIGMGGV